MFQVRSRRYRALFAGVSSAIAVVGGVLLAPIASAYTPYRTCTTDLLGLNLDPATAAAACAGALYPDEVGDCVLMVTDGTMLTAPDALAACRRVRRPEDMADCVVDITADLPAAAPLSVLDHCRRSLLPDRYESCVTEIAEAVDTAPEDLLAVCLSAGDRPRDLAPSFIPRLATETDATIQIQPFPLPDR